MSLVLPGTSLRRGMGASLARQPAAPVNAKSFGDVYPAKDEPEPKRGLARYVLSIAGMRPQVTWRGLMNSLAYEFLGSFLIATIVPLTIWMCSTPSVVPVSAFMVAVTEAFVWLAVVRYGTRDIDFSLPRHCNGWISLAYFGVGQIGGLGFLLYLAAQKLAALCAGFVVRTMLEPFTVVLVGDSWRSTVPIPSTVRTSYNTIMALHLCVPMAVVVTKLVVEYLNTEGILDSQQAGYATVENQKRLRSNFKKSNVAAAVITFGLIMLSYQFDAFAFNDVVYSGGLFSGLGVSDTALKGIGKLARLSSADYTNSVWGVRTEADAAAFYQYMGMAGALLGVLVYLIWGFIGFENGPGEGYRRNKPGYQQYSGGSAGPAPAETSASESAPQ